MTHVVERCPSCGVEHDISHDSACEACHTPLRLWCRRHGRDAGWLNDPVCPRCADEAAPALPSPAPAVPSRPEPEPAAAGEVRTAAEGDDAARWYVVDRCRRCAREYEAPAGDRCGVCGTPLLPWCTRHGWEVGWLDDYACPACAHDPGAPPPGTSPPVRGFQWMDAVLIVGTLAAGALGGLAAGWVCGALYSITMGGYAPATVRQWTIGGMACGVVVTLPIAVLMLLGATAPPRTTPAREGE